MIISRVMSKNTITMTVTSTPRAMITNITKIMNISTVDPTVTQNTVIPATITAGMIMVRMITEAMITVPQDSCP